MTRLQLGLGHVAHPTMVCIVGDGGGEQVHGLVVTDAAGEGGVEAR